MCRSDSLFFSVPSLSSAQLKFKSVAPHAAWSVPAAPRVYRMAAAASSSPSSVSTTAANTNPPPSSSSVHDGAPSASSAIDFLSICHRLKGKDLDEFFQSTDGKFQTETGKAWASEIVSRRRKYN